MSTQLVDRIRSELAAEPDIDEIRMFGGYCYTWRGNMLVGAMKNGDLLVRVGADGVTEALERPGAARMSMGGRTMNGFVVVAASELGGAALSGWIETARAVVTPLPTREKRPAKAKAQARPVR